MLKIHYCAILAEATLLVQIIKKSTFKNFILLFTIIPFPAPGQENIKFEQIAFEFYKNTILKENPPKKKLTIWLELQVKDTLYWWPECLNDFTDYDNIISRNLSGITNLEFIKDERFRVRKSGKGIYPKVYLRVSFSNRNDQHVVTVVELYKYNAVTYNIEMNGSGKVVNWCKGGWDK